MALIENTTDNKKTSTGRIIAISCSAIVLCILLIPISVVLWFWGLQTKVVWKFPVGNTVMSAPVIDGGVIYFGSLRDNENKPPAFYALDAKTGKEIWTRSFDGSVFWSPVVNDEMVFFSTDDGFFYGIDRQTGLERWSFGPEQRNITVKAGCEQCELKFGPPIIVGGVIYVGSFDHNVYAFDAQTGRLKWKFETNGSVLNAPVFVDGKLYVSGSDAYFYVLDPQTGKEAKRYLVPVDPKLEKFDSSGVHSTPIVDSDTIYIVNGMLLALDAGTGAGKWQFGDATMSDLIMTATQLDDRVIVTTTNAIYAVDKETGKTRWSFSNIKGNVFFAPTLYDGSIYFGDSNGYIYRIDAVTGHLIVQYHMNLFDLTSYANYFNGFVFTPAVQDDVIYVGWNSHVYAIRTK
jgi:eukaryotic-like serine/threonine-protein kinase